MNWRERAFDPLEVAQLARVLKISEFLAALLWQRNLRDQASAEPFLNPTLASLSCPFDLEGLDKAVACLRRALDTKQRILLYCDYDADGVTSSALLLSILRQLGAWPAFFVPRRLQEGYGLSKIALIRAFEEEGQPDLLIALDCGTNSSEAVNFVRDLGVEVLIVDHHQAKEGLPECILLNPHLNPAETSHQLLCTVGLVFKLVHGLVKTLKQEGDARVAQLRLRETLDLVALGTVADLVPLKGENRVFVHFGLQELALGRREGLRVLGHVCGMRPKAPYSTADISFKLAPRINASGRLDDARLPIELLLDGSEARCLQMAKVLDTINRDRQEIELEIVRCAQIQVEAQAQDSAGIVAFHEDWHPGVVGIVAGKLCRHFHKPAIVLGAEGPLAKGSGRSVAGVNLVEVLQSCQDLLTTWGGHPMAVGLSLPQSHVQAFREAFDQAIRQALQGKQPEPELVIDFWLEPKDLTADLLKDIDRLQPFGQGNPEPILGIRKVSLNGSASVFGENHDHIRFKMPTDRSGGLSVVGWKQAASMPPAHQLIDMAIKLSWNTWHQSRSPSFPAVLQAEMLAWRRSQCVD